MQPKVKDISIDDRWQEENGAEFGQLPTIRWVAHLEVRLIDKSTNWLGRQRHGGEVGELFGLTVCSPSFKSAPTSNYSDENLANALVQDRFSEEQAINYINKKLSDLGTISGRDLGEKLKPFLETEEWDTETKD